MTGKSLFFGTATGPTTMWSSGWLMSVASSSRRRARAVSMSFWIMALENLEGLVLGDGGGLRCGGLILGLTQFLLHT